MSIETLKKWLDDNNPGNFAVDELMSKHTSFRIGGPADLLFMPHKAVQVVQLLMAAREHDVPVTIMGNGSNLLVRDKGIRGLVIKLGSAMNKIVIDGDVITAEAGASLAALAMMACEAGLTGMEFAVGIPGSLGGGVVMNAGAYDGEMQNVVQSVTVIDRADNFVVLNKDELGFSYRHSILLDGEYVATEVVLKLNYGDKNAIKAKAADFTNRRISKQPLNLPSAGSMFKRPPGYFAGTLIEEAGLKGYTVGGAMVSEKHAGFVVNKGGASAANVLQLIKDVQDRVYAYAGVRLEPEVRVIGEE